MNLFDCRGLMCLSFGIFLYCSIGYVHNGQTIYTWEYLKRLYKASLLKMLTSYYKWRATIYESNVKVLMELKGMEI